jgi:hypothetical protein
MRLTFVEEPRKQGRRFSILQKARLAGCRRRSAGMEIARFPETAFDKQVDCERL